MENTRGSWAAEGGPQSSRYGQERTRKVGGAQSPESPILRLQSLWPPSASAGRSWPREDEPCQTVSSSLMSQICVETGETFSIGCGPVRPTDVQSCTVVMTSRRKNGSHLHVTRCASQVPCH